MTGESWFGGGADMTPTFVNKDDTTLFHQKMEEACRPYDETYYPKFKKRCDEYFYLPHRNEPRGEGGIFFDYMNTGDWETDFDFVKDVGRKTLEAITTIVNQHKELSWTAQEKDEQLLTGGSTEAILMSMPPTVKWA